MWFEEKFRKKALKELIRRDAQFGSWIKKIGPFDWPDQPKRMGQFHYLARCIVYQQLHAKAAGTIFGRYCDAIQSPKPTPESTLKLTSKQMRAAGLSKNKELALRDLATKTSEGLVPDARKVSRMSDEEVVKQLTQIRGIGVWTVEMMLMFKLGRADVFPVGDYSIRKGFERVSGLKLKAINKKENARMMKRAEIWRPYRSVVSYSLYRVSEFNQQTN